MDAESQVDWDEARRIVREWMAERKVNQSQLAKRADLNRSVVNRFFKGQHKQVDTAMRLFIAIQSSLSPARKHAFLKSTGLLPFAQALGEAPLVDGSLEDSHNRFELGTRLLLKGLELRNRDWLAALPVLEQAERTLGPASAQSPRCVCYIAQLHVNLGNYDLALSELERAEEQYKLVLDPETQYELWRLRGWILFYLGDLEQSAAWFRKAIRLARELGRPFMEIDPTHWLGRIEREFGLRGPTVDAHYHFQRSIAFHDAAHDLNESKDSGSGAFNIFRKAQTVQLTGDVDAARKLRDTARHIFGQDGGGQHHIAIEDARGELLDGNIKPAKRMAHDALEGWSDLYYAGGMSRALHVLALGDYVEGHLLSAFSTTIAALCVYANQLTNPQHELWNFLTRDLVPALIDVYGRKQSLKQLDFARQSAQERQGFYQYIDATTFPNIDAQIERIFARVRTLFGPS